MENGSTSKIDFKDTFIAAYHYLRIFNSWVEAYEYKPNSSGEVENPVLTGVPFNDAYRYMDWLVTVPLLLIEIVFVMKLSDEETKKKAITLGWASGLMICIGYPGELVTEGDLGVHCHQRRVRSFSEVLDPARTVLDSRQLVDLPSC